jgi:hypothetical protein
MTASIIRGGGHANPAARRSLMEIITGLGILAIVCPGLSVEWSLV